MYFALYQSIAKDEHRPGLYKEYDREFFDLIIVDECHRGSADDESNWREILEYFEPAYQLGMTATPLREENRDTYQYFGNPIYTYSLCEDQDEAEEMRHLLNNLNADLVEENSDYVCRIVSEEGDIGRGHPARFQDLEKTTPVIVTASRLLTTGVDVPTCKNVVLYKVINSMVDFKQIIGRGTRVRYELIPGFNEAFSMV